MGSEIRGMSFSKQKWDERREKYEKAKETERETQTQRLEWQRRKA